jgi:hypothetical protein
MPLRGSFLYEFSEASGNLSIRWRRQPCSQRPRPRLDEFPAGYYSSAGCSPAEPASASPAGHQYAVMSSCRSRNIHRTVNCVLTVCVSQGGKRFPEFFHPDHQRFQPVGPGRLDRVAAGDRRVPTRPAWNSFLNGDRIGFSGDQGCVAEFVREVAVSIGVLNDDYDPLLFR